MMRILIMMVSLFGAIFTLLWNHESIAESPATINGNNSGMPSLDVSYALKNRIAVNINNHDWGVSKASEAVDNFYNQHPGNFDELEVNAYRRALLGMTAIAASTNHLDSNRLIFYNVAYDIGLLLEWQVTSNNSFALKTALLVTGEVLRQEDVEGIPPGWIGTDLLTKLYPAYQGVKKATLGKTRESLNSAEARHSWTMDDGTVLSDRQVVHQRILLESIPLDMEKLDSSISEWPQQAHTSMQNANAASKIANNIVQCTKNQIGRTGLDALNCIQQKATFATISIPAKIKDQISLGNFFSQTFTEGALPVGDTSIAFVASTGLFNNYRFVVLTINGKPSSLTLIDLDR